MEKMKDHVQIGNFEIFLNERLGVCVPEDCPIRRSLLKLERCITISDAEIACLLEGLVGKNDYYGDYLYQAHGGARTLIDEAIFTGDCFSGNVSGTNSCGSILIYDTTKVAEFYLDLPVLFIRANWFIKNDIHPTS